MIKVIIVDDEAHAIEALSQLLQIFHPNVHICASCNTILHAVTAINEHKPDLVFLDIEIGQDNGFDVLKHFPKPAFKFVFITAFQDYAVQAFRMAALDYILKPVQPDVLAETIKKASDVLDRDQLGLKLDLFMQNMSGALKNDKKIILKTADNIHLVSLSDIVYCEADGGYTNFYLADKNRIMVSNTMGDYEELFNSYGFLRIHQSYLLNLHYFKRYDKADGGKAVLKNDVSLPVATRKKDTLLQRLSQL